MFPHADRIIDVCVKQGKNMEEIVDFCKSLTALNRDFILENFREYMTKIKKREEVWDIKIYDFIMDNYQRAKLFYDAGHPTNIIMKEISMSVLNKLQIQEQYIYTDIELDYIELPVYPVVRHVLNMDWKEREIRKSKGAKKLCDEMYFEEYIKQYLFWNYRDIYFG